MTSGTAMSARRASAGSAMCAGPVGRSVPVPLAALVDALGDGLDATVTRLTSCWTARGRSSLAGHLTTKLRVLREENTSSVEVTRLRTKVVARSCLL